MPFEDKSTLACDGVVDSPKLEWRRYLWQVGQRCADKSLNGLAI